MCFAKSFIPPLLTPSQLMIKVEKQRVDVPLISVDSSKCAGPADDESRPSPLEPPIVGCNLLCAVHLGPLLLDQLHRTDFDELILEYPNIMNRIVRNDALGTLENSEDFLSVLGIEIPATQIVELLCSLRALPSGHLVVLDWFEVLVVHKLLLQFVGSILSQWVYGYLSDTIESFSWVSRSLDVNDEVGLWPVDLTFLQLLFLRSHIGTQHLHNFHCELVGNLLKLVSRLLVIPQNMLLHCCIFFISEILSTKLAPLVSYTVSVEKLDWL